MRPARAIGLAADAAMKSVWEALVTAELARRLCGRPFLSRVAAISVSPLLAGLPIGPALRSLPAFPVYRCFRNAIWRHSKRSPL